VNVQIPSSSLPDATAACVPAREGRRFTVLLSSTLRGARLARRLTERQLADCQYPSESAEHIVAELVANAVQHGRVPGRDFRLTLALDTQGALRIEVTDLRAERIPRIPAASAPEQEVIAEGGRGLLIVDALADRWGVDIAAEPPARKVVWATLLPLDVVARARCGTRTRPSGRPSDSRSRCHVQTWCRPVRPERCG
jgi:anti-sigma regulatory factor (Ser/Thr protein kinase)